MRKVQENARTTRPSIKDRELDGEIEGKVEGDSGKDCLVSSLSKVTGTIVVQTNAQCCSTISKERKDARGSEDVCGSIDVCLLCCCALVACYAVAQGGSTRLQNQHITNDKESTNLESGTARNQVVDIN